VGETHDAWCHHPKKQTHCRLVLIYLPASIGGLGFYADLGETGSRAAKLHLGGVSTQSYTLA
jgi:hypothetical protein